MNTVISFKKLFDKLAEYETYLKREETQGAPISITANNTRGKNSDVVCQFCEKRGHSAKQCYHAKKIMLRENPQTPNHTTINGGAPLGWLLDSEASHHVTTDLGNLSLRQPYEGPDDIVIGDAIGLQFTLRTSCLKLLNHLLISYHQLLLGQLSPQFLILLIFIWKAIQLVISTFSVCDQPATKKPIADQWNIPTTSRPLDIPINEERERNRRKTTHYPTYPCQNPTSSSSSFLQNPIPPDHISWTYRVLTP
ncbi:hypothetical protein Ddye_029518 [Dipteronia dyeriana]|uniref:CCHC-type domain-containing protein n=1 Tax=Dipteronia dyeriana TaxID=168575 RepID=A0AAD9WKQ6_9ROSI|nr:hypothetical protein Ddye_029518 [Dipteronia dyeriana]